MLLLFFFFLVVSGGFSATTTNRYFKDGFQSCGNIGDREQSSLRCEDRWNTLFTCDTYIALISYVKDNVGLFPSTYSFDETEEIFTVNDNSTVSFSNFSELIARIYGEGASNETWTGTAENGMLTSQNCFDWALGLDCFYGTISNLTNQACDQLFSVDCFGVNCIPGTYTPTRSPTLSSPTVSPVTSKPSVTPSTSVPTTSPTTSGPTRSPTTSVPTSSPSSAPTTSSPTNSPTTSSPTSAPTTSTPSLRPTTSPTSSPTTSTPSVSPSNIPTSSPVLLPYVAFLTTSSYPATFNTMNAGMSICQQDAIASGLTNGRAFPFIAGFDLSMLGDMTSRAVVSLTSVQIAINTMTFLNGTLSTTLFDAGLSCSGDFWTGLELTGIPSAVHCSFFTTTTGNVRVGTCFNDGPAWKRTTFTSCSGGPYKFLCLFDPVNTWGPTSSPSNHPTSSPVTSLPTVSPSHSPTPPTTFSPSTTPTTSTPTLSPSTSTPSVTPTTSPTGLPYVAYLTTSTYAANFNIGSAGMSICHQDGIANGLTNGMGFAFIAGYDPAMLGDLSSRAVVSLTGGVIAVNMLAFQSGFLTNSLFSAGVTCPGPFWTGLQSNGANSALHCSFFTFINKAVPVGSCVLTAPTWKSDGTAACSSSAKSFLCLWHPANTLGPTGSPTTLPTSSPVTSLPTTSPSGSPTPPTTVSPSTTPTTSKPSITPSTSPSTTPTTSKPSITPSTSPTRSPTYTPYVAFVTIASYSPDFNLIPGTANQRCQEDAQTLGLTNGRAIAYVAGYDRSFFTDLTNRAVVSISNVKIANSITTFRSSALIVSLNTAGVGCTSTYIWTGLQSNGDDDSFSCTLFTEQSSAFGNAGHCFSTVSGWESSLTTSCFAARQFLCIWDPTMTWGPTGSPTSSPSVVPTTSKPSAVPTISPTLQPTLFPTNAATYSYAQIGRTGSTTWPPNPGFQQPNFATTAPRSLNPPFTPTTTPTAVAFQVTTAGTYAVTYQLTKLSAVSAAINSWLCVQAGAADACYGAGNTYPQRTHAEQDSAASATQAQISYIIGVPASYYISVVANIAAADQDATRTFFSVAKLSSLTNNFYRAVVNSPTTVSVPSPTPTPFPVSALQVSWLTPTPLPTSNPTLVTFDANKAKITFPVSGIWTITWSCYGSSGNTYVGIAINGYDSNDLNQRGWGEPGSRRTVGLDIGTATSAKWTGYLQANEYASAVSSSGVFNDNTAAMISIVYLPDLGHRVEVKALSQIKYGSPASKFGVIWNATSIRRADMNFTASNFNQTDGRVTFSSPGIFTITSWIQTISTATLCMHVYLNQLGSVSSTSSSFTTDTTGRSLSSTCHGAAAVSTFNQRSIQVTFPITSSSDYIQVVIETPSSVDLAATAIGSYDRIGLSIAKTAELAPPTYGPTQSPSRSPTASPTTSKPTRAPSRAPSRSPSITPSYYSQGNSCSAQQTASPAALSTCIFGGSGFSDNGLTTYTPVPSPYGSQVGANGLYFVSVQYSFSPAFQTNAALVVGTGSTDSSGQHNSYPWQATVWSGFSASDRLARFAGVYYLRATDYVRAITIGSLSGNVYQFMTRISTSTTSMYAATLIIATPIYTPPTTSPTPLNSYYWRWNTGALLPTSSPTLLSWDANTAFATIPVDGFYYINSYGFTSHHGVIVINDQTNLGFTRNAWSLTNGTARSVGHATGRYYDCHYVGFLAKGETVALAQSISSVGADTVNYGMTVSYVSPLSSSVWNLELAASGVSPATSPTYRFKVLWDNTVPRSMNIWGSPLSSYVDGSTGRITFPALGQYLVSFSCVVATNTPIEIGLYKNQESSVGVSTDGYMTNTKSLGSTGNRGTISPTPSPARFALSVSSVMIVKDWTDYMIAVVQSSGTSENTASLLVLAQTSLSIVFIASLGTKAPTHVPTVSPTKSPTTSKPTLSPSTSKPSRSPSAAPNIQYIQFGYSAQAPTPSPAWSKIAYITPATDRSLGTAPITPTSTPATYSFQATVGGLYDLQVQETITATSIGIQNAFIVVSTLGDTDHVGANINAYPARIQSTCSFAAGDASAFISSIAYLPTGYYVRNSHTGVETVTSAASFMAAAFLSTNTTRTYQTANLGSAPILVPTPTPTPFTAYSMRWNAPTPLPTSNPGLISYDANSAKMTLQYTGIWYFSCTFAYQPPAMMGLAFNGYTKNDFDTDSWASLSSSARTVALDYGYCPTVVFVGYATAGEYVSCVTSDNAQTTSGANTLLNLALLDDLGFHVETAAVGAFGYTSPAWRASLIFSTTFRAVDVGFTTGQFADQTTGKITFDSSGYYTVSFWVSTSTNSHICAYVLLNTDATSATTSQSFTASTGRVLGKQCNRNTAGVSKYAKAIRVSIPIYPGDYIQCVVESSNTGTSIIPNLVLGKTGVSIVKLRELKT